MAAKRTAPRALLVFVVVAIAVPLILLVTQADGGHRAAVAAPPELAVYAERAPHVLSQLNAYGVQGVVRGAPSTPPSALPPLSPDRFNVPEAEYRAFAGSQLGLMEGQITDLEGALAAGDRAAAQDAWRGAYSRYLELGAVYLEGQIATLNQAIDGNPGGLPGGIRSPQFTGLHRIELGLWTGGPLSSLLPYAHKLAADVRELRRVLPSVQISPLDYATRAHEILEDAVRDLLSGTDVPWSGEGVLGTEDGILATKEVLLTLKPLLFKRENVLPVANAQLATLEGVMERLKAAHGGRLPTNGELTQEQAELLDNAMGGALEALAQVPGALETAYTPVIPRIPRSAVRIDQP
jgi:iron uptake system EfeUOB component EfeO/EfeM